MYFDSILAVSDFSALSAHALDRAALLARQHQSTLRLVHFADSPDTYLADPIARLGQRARQLARRHEIPVHALERSASLKALSPGNHARPGADSGAKLCTRSAVDRLRLATNLPHTVCRSLH